MPYQKKVWFMTKMTHDNDVIDCIGVISIEYDIELSRPNEQCVAMTKVRQDNFVNDHIGPLYVENETNMS